MREVVYIESFSGETTRGQALRIKQLWKDFNCDIIVLDIKNIGVTVFEELGVVTEDNIRGEEYPAMGIMSHSSLDADKFRELASHTKALNFLPNIYPIDADQKMNTQIAVEMRDKLQKRMIEFLVNEMDAETYLLKDSKNLETLFADSDTRARALSVYFQTTLLINECINLKLSPTALASGNVKLDPSTSTGRKDRFSSFSYGNYFASLLDKELLHEEDTNDWEDVFMGLTQFL
jgi:hypothetical protein